MADTWVPLWPTRAKSLVEAQARRCHCVRPRTGKDSGHFRDRFWSRPESIYGLEVFIV